MGQPGSRLLGAALVSCYCEADRVSREVRTGASAAYPAKRLISPLQLNGKRNEKSTIPSNYSTDTVILVLRKQRNITCVELGIVVHARISVWPQTMRENQEAAIRIHTF
jgi:hypothetical protein